MRHTNGFLLMLLSVPLNGIAASPPVGSIPVNSAAPVSITMPASVASVKALLQAMQARKTLDDMSDGIDARLTAVMQRSTGGRALTPEQEEILVRAHDKALIVIRQAISWEAMEPIYVQMYREALTQRELDGMLVFYRTSAGKAYVEKIPRLAQAMVNNVQSMIASMMPQLAQITKETDEEMKLATPMFDTHVVAQGVRAYAGASKSSAPAQPCVIAPTNDH